GAFGVLAAFAVLVLTRVEQDIGAARDAVFQLKDSPTAWQTYVQHGTDEFLKRELPDSDFRGARGDIRLEHLKRGEMALRDKRNLRRPLWWAATLTAIDVTVSIIALPIVPRLADSTAWSLIVTGAAVLLAMVCVWLYGRVVLRVIRRVNGGRGATE